MLPMNDREQKRYKSLISHLPWHHARRWVRKGAEKEDARTILEAIHRLSHREFNRRFAEMLSRD